MLDALGYPGMKVLQFAFDSDPKNEHLPHNFRTPHCVCYTGTHDNETLKGWLAASNKKTVKYAKNYLRCKKQQIPDEMVAACWASIADTAIAQMQDFLHSERSARMNTPSTLGGNWMFRTEMEDFTPELAKEIRKLNRVYGRSVEPPAPEVIKPEPKPDPEKPKKPRRPYSRKKIEPPAQPTVTVSAAAVEEALPGQLEIPMDEPKTEAAAKPRRTYTRRKKAEPTAESKPKRTYTRRKKTEEA